MLNLNILNKNSQDYINKYHIEILNNINIKSNIELFFKYIKNQEDKRTILTTHRKIKFGLEYLNFIDKNFDDLNRSDIEKYLEYLSNNNTDKERNKKLRVIYNLFDYLLLHTNIKTNLIFKSDFIKTKIDKEIFSIEENVLLNILKHIEEINEKDVSLFFKIGVETGLRAKDIKQLKYDCLLKENEEYYLVYDISKMKINNHKVLIHKEMFNLIKKFIINYSTLDKNKNPLQVLFCPKVKGTKYIDTIRVKNRINDLILKYNIKGENGEIWRYTNHQLRHYKVKMLYNSKKMNLLNIKEYIGHRSDKMTQKYLQVNDKEVKNEIVEKNNKIFDISLIENLKKGFEATRVFEGYCIKPKIFKCDKEECFNCEYYNKDNIEKEISKTENLIEMLKNKKIENNKNNEYLKKLKELEL